MSNWQDGYLRGEVNAKVSVVNRLMEELRGLKHNHPELKLGHYESAGSILNAYREGDLSFDEALERLEEISGRKASGASK